MSASTKTAPLVGSASAGPLDLDRVALERNGGSIPKETIDAHDGAMRRAPGNEHEHVNDVITLDSLEDLDELHKSLGH